MAERYLQQRNQFGSPLGAFQLQQERLARMAGNINVRSAPLVQGFRVLGLRDGVLGF